MELDQNQTGFDQLENRSYLQLMFNRMPIACMLFDHEFRVVYWNQEAEKIFGYSAAEAMGKRPYELFVPETAEEQVKSIWRRLLEGSETAYSTNENTTKDGRTILCNWFNTPLHTADGKFTTVLSIAQDITEQEKIQRALQESEARYRNLFNRIPIGIYRTSPSGQIIEANPALVDMLAFPSLTALLNSNSSDLFIDPENRMRQLDILERDGMILNYELHLRRYDGKLIWAVDNVRTVYDENSQILYFEGTLEDVSERKIAEEQLRFLATHDSLTGLPNRALLQDRLNHALIQARRKRAGELPNSKVAVMMLDMDNFKIINDTYGHARGDQVLKATADRIRGCVRKGDTIARMGGDEFTIVLDDLDDEDCGGMVAQKILDALKEPIIIDLLQFTLGVSIGISVYPTDGEDVDILLRTADTALYKAKETRNTFKFYTL